jgi:cell division protein FtsA
MSRDSKDLIVGLDIGTSKIVALVAEVTPEGRLNVIGMGSQESKGLKKGVVVNIEETVATISRVLQEVELMADCKVRDVIPGSPAATSGASTRMEWSPSRTRK